MRILAVEDSKTQALELRLALERGGHQVQVSYDGATALAAAAADRPDLVVSDILMPGIDGYELCRRMRRDPATSDVPVMLLTSLNDPLDVVRALDAGADNFISKPYDTIQLLARVARTARRRAQPAGTLILGGVTRVIELGPRVLDVLVSALEDAAARNAELEASRRQLLEAAAQREEMLSIVAHELRNPLNVILGRAQIEPSAANTSRPLADIVQRHAANMSVIIDDLLDVTRLEAGNFALDPRRVRLDEVVRSTIERERELSPRHEIDFRDEASPEVVVDVGRIGQVVTNYVANARKYSEPGSRIDVAVAGTDGGWARLSVRDQGIGVEPEAIPKLFTRYYRTDSAKRTAPGIGVGLYVCKLLIEAQGGRVGVTSRPGSGSTFWFELPPAT